MTPLASLGHTAGGSWMEPLGSTCQPSGAFALERDEATERAADAVALRLERDINLGRRRVDRAAAHIDLGDREVVEAARDVEAAAVAEDRGES